MLIPIIIICLGAVALFWFLFEKVKAYSLKAVFIKTTASMLFVVLGAYGLYKTNLKAFSLFTVIGLSLGMLGDIFLDLKYVFKEKDFEFTLAGFIVFGLGHICYTTGLLLEFYTNQNVLYIIIPLVLAVLMGPGSLLMEKTLKLNYGKLRWAAFCYAIAIFGFLFSGFSVWMMMGFKNTGLMMAFVGIIAFVTSDMILNFTYFGKDHEKPFDIISNTITYYGAQYVIALAILFM